MLEEGSKAPDFTLPGDGGDKIKLSALASAPVVVYFYPKDDTPGCTKEAIAFTALLTEFEKLGVTIIGVSPDSIAAHDKFIAKDGLGVRLAADEGSEVADKYGVWVEKSMYGRKYLGIERSTFVIGRDGKLVREWRGLKVPGHAQQVLEFVGTL